MDEVNDQTFAQELLGPGIAIVPSNGTVVSPINGTIATVMDTKHAVCIQGEDGLELIVHAGLDTVELNGKYYQTYKEIVFAFFSNIFFNESNIFFSFFYTAFSDPLDMHR